MKNKKIFYGWFIVLAGMMITAAGIGIFNSTNSVFVKPVCDALGFSRGEFTLHRTIITLIAALLTPLYGKYIQRFGVKKIFLFSSVGLSLAALGYSFATQIWHFYAVAVINGIFLNGINFMTVGVMVSRWFTDKKGFATGLAFCGSGLGGAVTVPFFGHLVEAMGWRESYQMMALLGALILLPIVLLLVKESPADMGLQPYRDLNKISTDSLADSPHMGITLKESLKTPAFWMLIVSFFLIAICAAGPNTHTVPYLTDIGYSTTFATSVVSVFMIVLTAGKILLGVIFDKFGPLAGSVFVGICCIGFPIFALLSQYPAAPWVYAVVLGLASSGFSVPVTVLIAKYFGTKDFPAIFSICTMITSLGTSASVPMMGAMYDSTGSYQIAWIILLVLAIILTFGLIGANIYSKQIAMQIKGEAS